MKKQIILITLIAAIIALPFILSAQPQPWDPTVGGGEGTNPVGGGASIGGGLLVLISLAAGYGARKLYNLKKRILS
ncbi:MAG: hypothetical protein JW861_03810 [Bacteroidales bacterium]|nr:hypothetical protein [Bacteroidales bacterium]